MKILIINKCFRGICIFLLFFIMACSSSGKKETKQMENRLGELSKGTYGYDVAFFSNNDIEIVELQDAESQACLMLIPDYQGRVMTSTAGGNEGASFGWINYDLIESGEINNQFNPVGGEERLWFGPEGGPFSVYFAEGKEQEFANWLVPPVIDTESFEVVKSDSRSVTFAKNTILINASGTEFNVGIERQVSLLEMETVEEFLGVDIPSDLSCVAYQTDNIITNIGDDAWEKQSGLLSIWMLCMFNPTPTTTVFIPYKTEEEGVIVNDDYFGKVPEDRLIVDNGTIFFKIDGKHRSKIGLPYNRATSLCGSYDSDKKVLTLLWCSLPDGPAEYVNSKWGNQEDSYNGDAINSYNDGPVEDGSIMGPFYEIETSSPGAELQPSESLKHTQRIMHFEGDEAELEKIVNELFNLELTEIAGKF
jgi:hypothetical protein